MGKGVSRKILLVETGKGRPRKSKDYKDEMMWWEQTGEVK